MKKLLLKIFTSCLIFCSVSASAQNDTLIWTDFESDPSGYIQTGVFPPGTTSDTSWYNYDGDGLSDMSGGNRPLEWFWTFGFATVDSANSVMGSSSWTLATSPTLNYLITPSIQIVDTNAVLSWKSAPYQTPRYMDGYKVVVSIASNDVSDFTDTIFKAAEFLATNNSSTPASYSNYDFSAGFVHGADLTYTEYDATTADSGALYGVLRPFSVSLSQFSGKTIFICFLHESTDDNLLALDDILLMGTNPATVGIKENKTELAVNLYPNPANEKVSVLIELKESSDATIDIFDLSGRKVYSEQKNKLAAGKQISIIDISNFASGIYQVQVTTADGTSTTKLNVKK